MLFVENSSKLCYVTNEIMKRYLFVLCYYLSVMYLLYKKFNISFIISLLLYGFHQFKQKMLMSAYFKGLI